jgi:hypothetical protein
MCYCKFQIFIASHIVFAIEAYINVSFKLFLLYIKIINHKIECNDYFLESVLFYPQQRHLIAKLTILIFSTVPIVLMDLAGDLQHLCD